MTEAEARAALRAFVGVGDVEPWIAGRPWQAAPGVWTVGGELQGWSFRLGLAVGGVRVGGAAGRPWLAARGVGAVGGELQGWIFRLELAVGGVRVVAAAAGGQSAVWIL